MSNLFLNVLFDAYPNVEAAERSLYPYLDRVANDAIQVTTGARAEQGFTFAKRLKSRYSKMDVIFRKLPDDNQHEHMSAAAWFDSYAPWSDGGKLILSNTNEPGTGNLAAQDTWMAATLGLAGANGIRVVTWNLQTHNHFNPAQIIHTLKLCEIYHHWLGLHYYFDAENGFPLDPVHETIDAYCLANQITPPQYAITELGYAERLASKAGYHGRYKGNYGLALVAPARRYRKLKFFVYGWGKQDPWGDFDISEDQGVQDEIVKFNQESVPVTPVIQIPPNEGIGVPSTVIETGIRLRPTPDLSATAIRSLLRNEQVVVYPGGAVSLSGYPFHFLRDRDGKALGWASIADKGGAVWIQANEAPVDPSRVVIENIPYSSEFGWETGWTALCGETSLYMLLEYDRLLDKVLLPPEITPHSIALYLGKGAKDFTNLTELQKAATAYGLATRVITTAPGVEMKALQAYINIPIMHPMIVLLDYSKLPTRWDKKFGGGHILVVVGYSDQSIVVHDPDSPDAAHGQYISYPRADFAAAWSAMGNTALVLA